MKKHQFKIAVLMPTRARTDAFSRSLFSLINQADHLDDIQFILGIDNDDTIGLTHFTEVIQPELDERNINYQALGFERLGYAGLNIYYNSLAEHSDADWLFVWCDDAIMKTAGWDQRITECTGEFKLLKVHTHNEHPYSIFPIVPAEWREVTGYISKHQLIDTEVSHLAYLLDLMKIIEVDVTHDRHDLTGNNKDETATKNKPVYEGNPNNPWDFHHNTFANLRFQDAEKIAEYMKSCNISTEWWEGVKTGVNGAWDKMRENDPNGQTKNYDFKEENGKIKMIARND
jgi:hypothetical protein